MSEWELRVSQRDVHRMHVVRLTMEGRESVAEAQSFLGSRRADFDVVIAHHTIRISKARVRTPKGKGAP